VTTTQAGCSKRPRDVEGDSSTNAEEGVPEKIAKLTKRLRTPMHGGVRFISNLSHHTHSF